MSAVSKYESTKEKQKSEMRVSHPKVEAVTNGTWNWLVASDGNLNHIHESPSMCLAVHLNVTSCTLMKTRGVLQVNLYRIEYRFLVMITPKIYKVVSWISQVET